jgi:gamma-glutamylputrescine oxidase
MKLQTSIDSHYARIAPAPLPRPALQETIEAEVCVIGGGLAGLSTALGLAARGVKAAVLESGLVGGGASGRSAGFVLSGFCAEERDIVKKAGAKNMKAMYRLTLDALKTMRGRIRDFGIDCNPVDGYLTASWYDTPDALKKEAAFYQELGETVEFWPRRRVREVCRTKRYYDGLFCPDQFHMDPLAYARGLARAAEKDGVKIYENTPATGVNAEGAEKIVDTPQGRVRAKHIVYCGSAYFNGIDRNVSRACLPVTTYVMVTEKLPPETLAAAVRAPFAIRDNRTVHSYYRPLPDGRLLWGGRVGGEKTPRAIKKLLTADMRATYPQLAGVKIESAWFGHMGYSRHHMPHIGAIAPGAWVCTSFGGHGLCPTTMGGELIASAIAENDQRHRLFEPFRLDYAGGRLGPLAAQVFYRYWEAADKIRELRFNNRASRKPENHDDRAA